MPTFSDCHKYPKNLSNVFIKKYLCVNEYAQFKLMLFRVKNINRMKGG